MDNQSEKNKERDPVFKIIQEIKEGKRVARDLPKNDRQECVEALYLEGYSIAQMAQLLDRAEKTMTRDMGDIRERNCAKPSLELATQLIGDMVLKCRAHQAHLMRLARSKEGSVQEKAQAEYYAWKVESEMMERLQTLGYLPSAPQKIVGDIYHHSDDDDKAFLEAKEKLREVEAIAKDTGVLDEATQKGIENLKAKIEKAEIVKEIKDLNKNQDNKGEETKNE
jgi:hypothetical protein